MEHIDRIIKEAVATQLDMFGGEPEVVKKPRKKMSDKEKEERREKKAIQKKLKQEKEFEDYWASVGHPQLYMFDDDGNTLDDAIQHVVKEQIDKMLDEESGIHIKPENKGKFTATKEKTGKSTSELLHSKNKKTRARANFARMAKRGWRPLKK